MTNSFSAASSAWRQEASVWSKTQSFSERYIAFSFSQHTVLRRKFFGLMYKYRRQSQWCWEEFRGRREVKGLGWINNKLESLIKTWSDMHASFLFLLLSVPDLDEAWGIWGVKSFLASDFAFLHYLHIWRYSVPVPRMMWHDKWRDKRPLNLMQETTCNFCLSIPACVEQAILQTGSPPRQWESSCLAGSHFLLHSLHISLEKNWAAETRVLVRSFSLLLLFQYWPSLLTFFCVSHHGWLEPTDVSLSSARPDALGQDFWCCLFQAELEIPATCWLFPIQSLQGEKGSTYSKCLLLQYMKPCKVGMVLMRKAVMCIGSKNGCHLRPLAVWMSTCWREVTVEFWRCVFPHRFESCYNALTSEFWHCATNAMILHDQRGRS